MHVIIAGCGRVGSQLAQALGSEGNEVVVIDKNPAAFDRLPEEFAGQRLRGIVFDRETLEHAGIKRAGAFIAVTSGDNSNIVAARTARERYGVERVVARIYDPVRAEIFERLGITIVASARWTADAIQTQLAPFDERVEGKIGPGIGDVLMVTLRVPPGSHGVAADQLTRPGQSVLTAITRAGNTTVPQRSALLEAGDIIHVAVERSALDEVRERVHHLAEEHV